MLTQQVSLESIMEYGRWASVASARLYLRRGEVALLRCRGDFSDAVAARLQALSTISSRVWILYKLLSLFGSLSRFLKSWEAICARLCSSRPYVLAKRFRLLGALEVTQSSACFSI